MWFLKWWIFIHLAGRLKFFYHFNNLIYDNQSECFRNCRRAVKPQLRLVLNVPGTTPLISYRRFWVGGFAPLLLQLKFLTSLFNNFENLFNHVSLLDNSQTMFWADFVSLFHNLKSILRICHLVCFREEKQFETINPNFFCFCDTRRRAFTVFWWKAAYLLVWLLLLNA